MKLISIKLLVVFCLLITVKPVFSQQLRLLNAFYYPVYDTSKFNYYYFEIKQEENNLIDTKVFNLDSVLVRRSILVTDSSNSKTSERITEFYESRTLKSLEIIDFVENKNEKKEYYENGSLKSHEKKSNNELVFGKYYSEEGEEVQKPIFIPGMPEGGMEKWTSFLSKNLRYPFDAQVSNSEGTVILVFIIDEDGTIIDPQVANPEEVFPSLAEEALRMIEKYPDKWTPSTLNGEFTKVRMRLPIRFKLTD